MTYVVHNSNCEILGVTHKKEQVQKILGRLGYSVGPYELERAIQTSVMIPDKLWITTCSKTSKSTHEKIPFFNRRQNIRVLMERMQLHMLIPTTPIPRHSSCTHGVWSIRTKDEIAVCKNCECFVECQSAYGSEKKSTHLGKIDNLSLTLLWTILQINGMKTILMTMTKKEPRRGR